MDSLANQLLNTNVVETELDDDDIWLNDDTYVGNNSFGSDGNGHINKNPTLASLRHKHYNEGYVDGITYVKETSMQKGFDDGFPHGASLALKFGEIIGKLQGIIKFLEEHPELVDTTRQKQNQGQRERTTYGSESESEVALDQSNNIDEIDIHHTDIKKLLDNAVKQFNIVNVLSYQYYDKGPVLRTNEHPLLTKWGQIVKKLINQLYE